MFNIRLLCISFIFVMPILFNRIGYADEIINEIVLSGNIYSTENPSYNSGIQGVHIIALGSFFSSVTDSQGMFNLNYYQLSTATEKKIAIGILHQDFVPCLKFVTLDRYQVGVLNQNIRSKKAYYDLLNPISFKNERKVVIKGIILQENGKPADGVELFLCRSDLNATTDREGNYLLEIPPDLLAQLYLDKEPLEIIINKYGYPYIYKLIRRNEIADIIPIVLSEPEYPLLVEQLLNEYNLKKNKVDSLLNALELTTNKVVLEDELKKELTVFVDSVQLKIRYINSIIDSMLNDNEVRAINDSTLLNKINQLDQIQEHLKDQIIILHAQSQQSQIIEKNVFDLNEKVRMLEKMKSMEKDELQNINPKVGLYFNFSTGWLGFNYHHIPVQGIEYGMVIPPGLGVNMIFNVDSEGLKSNYLGISKFVLVCKEKNNQNRNWKAFFSNIQGAVGFGFSGLSTTTFLNKMSEPSFYVRFDYAQFNNIYFSLGLLEIISFTRDYRGSIDIWSIGITIHPNQD